MYLKARAGVITSSRISFSACQNEAIDEAERFDKVLKDREIQEIRHFRDFLGVIDFPRRHGVVESALGWLDVMFGK